MNFKFTASLLSLVIWIAIPVAKANVITYGSITVTGRAASGPFAFGGEDFFVQGSSSLGVWRPLNCSPCLAGSALGVNGLVVGNDIYGGSAVIDDRTYFVNWGSLNAGGPSILSVSGDEILLGNVGGTYRGFFSFQGSLCGMASTQFGPCLVNLPNLTGRGYVDVDVNSFLALGGKTLLEVRSAKYTFVPEPGSLMLFAIAIAGLGFLGRRRLC